MCEPKAAWIWTRGSSSSQKICAPTRSGWKAATHRLTRTATPESEGEVVMEWNAMLVLGAYHGVNPGMGWLFAVALGMQQRNVRGVLAALPPMALGHAVAVGVVVLAAGLAGLGVPIGALKIAVA